MARVIQNTTRQTDPVCRYGGDEFLVILPMANKARAKLIKEKIALKIEEIGISVSIGVATWSDDARSIDKLLEVADLKMYAEKRSAPYYTGEVKADRRTDS